MRDATPIGDSELLLHLSRAFSSAANRLVSQGPWPQRQSKKLFAKTAGDDDDDRGHGGAGARGEGTTP
ncbi:hypothetical protein E2562_029595 [Oryza meyeriana var. granulata]|uniref:Uncharacterized protein n=1 Tax=Oryza meyeriana var. granulata TaxID=110450 RepID=A0A6G1E3V0_9ORYZ|nr:hypothetical protein E2562_029595 [Oryza meyeriana var. granulata]